MHSNCLHLGLEREWIPEVFNHVNLNKLFDQEALNLCYRHSNMVDTSNIKDELMFIPQLYVRIYAQSFLFQRWETEKGC